MAYQPAFKTRKVVWPYQKVPSVSQTIQTRCTTRGTLVRTVSDKLARCFYLIMSDAISQVPILRKFVATYDARDGFYSSGNSTRHSSSLIESTVRWATYPQASHDRCAPKLPCFEPWARPFRMIV